MRTEARKLSQKRYQQKGVVQERLRSYNLRLHVVHDADVIAKLDSVENRSGYIKALIRADIAKKMRTQ